MVSFPFLSRPRSEEHTSELQSPIDISYAVFCLKKKTTINSASAGPSTALPGTVSSSSVGVIFFFNDTATTEIYTSIDTLSLHDALPIFPFERDRGRPRGAGRITPRCSTGRRSRVASTRGERRHHRRPLDRPDPRDPRGPCRSAHSRGPDAQRSGPAFPGDRSALWLRSGQLPAVRQPLLRGSLRRAVLSARVAAWRPRGRRQHRCTPSRAVRGVATRRDPFHRPRRDALASLRARRRVHGRAPRRRRGACGPALPDVRRERHRERLPALILHAGGARRCECLLRARVERRECRRRGPLGRDPRAARTRRLHGQPGHARDRVRPRRPPHLAALRDPRTEWRRWRAHARCPRLAGVTVPVRDQVAAAIKDGLARASAELGWADVDGVPVDIERPGNPEHGDYASNIALKLAKQARKPPRDIAKAIRDRVRVAPPIAAVEELSGFVNVRLDEKWLAAQVDEIVRAGTGFGRSTVLAGKRMQVEFVSA